MSPAEVGDIETDTAKLETGDTLRVYAAGSPAGNRAMTIQDELIPLASPPALNSMAALEAARKQIVAKLLEKHSSLPSTPPRLDIDEEFALDGGAGTRFAFTSEDGWRLHGLRSESTQAQGTAPAVVVLRSPVKPATTPKRSRSRSARRGPRSSWRPGARGIPRGART